MKVWLDDVRPVPADDWVLVKTVEEAIALLETGEVDEISLDNDLGCFEREGREVIDWIEKKFAMDLVLPPKKIHIHTTNPSAARYMEVVRDRIEKMAYALETQNKK